MTSPTPAGGGAVGEGGRGGVSNFLPLRILRSQLVPPAPNRHESAIDWLADFGGSSWIAYGAASLLVISHFPSPHSRGEAEAGPFFQQVIELPPPPHPGATPALVSAVSWCPAIPSEGEIAAAAGSCIWMYAAAPGPNGSGSFSWEQTAVILDTFRVEAVNWTESGDALIAAGMDVVLWLRKKPSWELTWRLRAKIPQTLVSATWCAQGPFATAAYSKVECSRTNNGEESHFSEEEHKHALVYLSDTKSGLTTVQLSHPQAVSMIQWRPSLRVQSVHVASRTRRDVLLTCCLDGTVRLWTETDSGSPVKHSKEAQDHRVSRRSFHVIAVIEIDTCLNGTLGRDIALKWAIELGGVISRGEGDKYALWSGDFDQHDVGKCEWLISIGPRFSVTLWSIHCLDDVSPARYPRVTLWKTQQLTDSKEFKVDYHVSRHANQQILIKSTSSRRLLSDPPVICSLLYLMPDNSFIWLNLHSSISHRTSDEVTSNDVRERNLSCCLSGVINQDGHVGSIRQVSLHPYSKEIELAVSLDSNGLLLFWSLSNFSTFTWSPQTLLHPLWKLLAKIDLRDFSTDVGYSCMCWAPSVLDENCFLLLGSECGVDCFIVRISVGQTISCHKMLTIPFADSSYGKGPPDHIFASPLDSSCGEPFCYNRFFLFCVWMNRFCVFSWKIVLHCESPQESKCDCGLAAMLSNLSETSTHTCSFEGKVYHATTTLGSSGFPTCQSINQTTSVAGVSTNNSILSSCRGMYSFSSSYHMATGGSDGTLNLWKMSIVKTTNSQSEGEYIDWELVGMFAAHQGPVTAVSLSSCGRKIATISSSNQTNTTDLHIWDPVCWKGWGSFLLEDAIILHAAAASLSWVSLGNGQLLLGVCLPNEFRVYSQKRPTDQNCVYAENPKTPTHIWDCIAVSHSYHDIKGFLWGPKVTPVLVHENHLSLFTHCLYRTDIRNSMDNLVTYAAGVHEELPAVKHVVRTLSDDIESSKGFSNWNNGCGNCIQQESFASASSIYDLIDVADRLGGPLAVYHPKALIQHLCSGNWKRAEVVLQHLVQSCKTSKIPNVECSRCGKLRHCIPEIHLSKYFMERNSMNFATKGLLWGENNSSGVSNLQFHSEVNNFITTQKTETSFVENLDKHLDMSIITESERSQILAIADLLGEIRDPARVSPYRSLDEAGRKFWIAVRFQRLYAARKFGDASIVEEINVDSALVSWAFQSDCQDDLLNSILSSEPTWSEMRNLGVGLWYTNTPQLRNKMEKLARLQYLQKKDAKDCALLYIALNRLQVLAGLFKISKDEKDKVLFGFLSRNFQEEKNKAAALKNAYVLMGRHQLELAIAFFLLGDDPSSAVTVCAKNLGDEQLALVICRLIEGYGGSLEHDLISNVLLPKAVQKGDHWLSSLFEWILGNFSQSVQKLFDSNPISLTDKSASWPNLAVSSDPNIGQYCVVLATKTNFKNSVGETLAAILSKLSTALVANAFNRCGLHLEALEYFSSTSNVDSKDHNKPLSIGDHPMFHGILNPFSVTASNWLSEVIVSKFDYNFKLIMASKYLSKFLRSHPWCSHCNLSPSKEMIIHEGLNNDLQIGEVRTEVKMAMSVFEKNFSLNYIDLAEMILTFTCSRGQLFLSYLLLFAKEPSKDEINDYYLDGSTFSLILVRLLLKASNEICCFVVRYVVSSDFIASTLKFIYKRDFSSADSYRDKLYLASLANFLRIGRSLLKHCEREICVADNELRIIYVFDLLEYSIEFSFAWLLKDARALIMMISPVLDALVNEHSSFLTILQKMRKILHQKVNDSSSNRVECSPDGSCQEKQPECREEEMLSIDEKWHIIGACLWVHLSTFLKRHLNKFREIEKLKDKNDVLDMDFINLFPLLAVEMLMNSVDCISSLLIKQFASFLKQKLGNNLPSNALFWLEDSCSQLNSLNRYNSQLVDSLLELNIVEKDNLINLLWKMSVSSQDIYVAFANGKINGFLYNNSKLSRSWKDIKESTSSELESGTLQVAKAENKLSTVVNYGIGQGHTSRVLDSNEPLETKGKPSTAPKDISLFQNPRVLIKRTGELLEAICFDSTNEQQVALASNRRGLLFFNWNDEHHHKEQSDYIWSESDWPLDGWAGCESTPVPTYVSPGIGLGSKSGAHLGLGGATIGIGSLAKPGRDVTGGGAFGIPGYAGIGASALSWGEQEDFEECIDPPATLENIHAQALCCHPLRPLFLVGSSNTHVYLWEFGKDRALATYGVLPAANVPPPYALASVSSVQFDHYGHRFATAALDGTVCTWQLEVGGRSNVRPIDSSLCFNINASDVEYVAASGSILAAAGCNSNGINLVVWDTLAPPTTCQASVVCHEGGTRSLSVFDNDIGSGSISPLIVTGGKAGDVGLHDFRFITTGKARRHKNSSDLGVKSSALHDTSSRASSIGDNTNGMIWYIPKAHLGSVTKVATIPNTSLFLTGSADGDVKLWDAKRCQMVFHWSKLHERHTFYQSNSRVFGGVVRAAVTDIQVLSHGFLSCGGDGSVKLVQLK